MIVINNTTSERIDGLKLKKIGQKFLQSYRQEAWSVSLAIIGPARMRRLNNDYRGLDYPTDVLSFPAAQTSREEQYLGEIFINLAAVKKLRQYQALFQELQGLAGLTKSAAPKKPLSARHVSDKQSLKSARTKQATYLLYFLFVHGLLHLLGYEDESVKGRQAMLRRGGQFLASLGYWPVADFSIQ